MSADEVLMVADRSFLVIETTAVPDGECAMRITPNPLLVVLALGTLLAPPILAQEAPVLVSAEWLEEHLEDPSVVVLFVGMAHEGTPSPFIAGAAFLDYLPFQTSRRRSVLPACRTTTMSSCIARVPCTMRPVRS